MVDINKLSEANINKLIIKYKLHSNINSLSIDQKRGLLLKYIKLKLNLLLILNIINKLH